MPTATQDPETDSEGERTSGSSSRFQDFSPAAIKSHEARAATGGTVRPSIDSVGVKNKGGLAPSLTDRLPGKQLGGASDDGTGDKKGGLFKEGMNPVNLTPEGMISKKVTDKVQQFVGDHKKGLGAGTGIAAALVSIFMLFGSVAVTNELNSVMTTMINRFFGTAEHDVTRESNELMDAYIKRRILKRLGPGCEDSSKLSAECMKKESTPDADPATDPVDALDEALDKWDMPAKLADQGFTFVKAGDGTIRLHADGLPDAGLDVSKYILGQGSIFDDPALPESVAENLSNAIQQLLPAATGDGGSLVHVVVPAEVAEEGADMCAMDCDPGNEATEQATETPADEANFALATEGEAQDIGGSAAADGVEDLFNTSSNPSDNSTVDPATGTVENSVEVQTEQDAEQVAAKLGSTTLAKLVASASALKSAAGGAVAKALANSLSLIPGVDITGDTLSDVFSSISDKIAGGPVAIAQIVAQFISGVSGLTLKLKIMNYLVHKGPSMFMFVKFAASLAEQKSGGDHVSLLKMGSEINSLSANGSTASQSEWYQQINDPNNTPSNVTSSSINKELSGEKVSVNHYSSVLTKISTAITSIPGFNYLSALAGVVNTIINYAFLPVTKLLSFITSITGINNLIGLAFGALMKFIVSEVVSMPNLTTAGGKTQYDVLAEGSDFTGNETAEADGGKQLTPAQAGALTAEQEQLQMKQFQQLPLFARVFSTDTPYSLVSKLTLDIPWSFGSAFQGTLADVLSNPFGQVFHSFSTIFTSSIAHAATPAQADPAGVTQYGVPDSDPVFSTDPGTYWTQHNCAQQEAQGWPEWNSPANTSINPDTGQVEHNTTNGCLLIINSAKAAGAVAGYTGT